MPEPLNSDLIKADLARYRDGMDVIVHQTISSTNDWSLQQCKSGRKLPFACFAENQTSGKGRRGKRWVMAASSNIAFSLSWPFILSKQSMQLLPLSVAVAVSRTLASVKLEHVRIKWPNDVYIHDKKVAGILIETQPIHTKTADAEAPAAVVIGVGLNFEMADSVIESDDELQNCRYRITDITRELKSQGVAEKVGRQDIASLLLQNIVSACECFQSDGKAVLDEFRAGYDFCANKTVEILLDNQETLMGVAIGVNDEAELLVKIDGEVRAFNSADVSVKTDI